MKNLKLNEIAKIGGGSCICNKITGIFIDRYNYAVSHLINPAQDQKRAVINEVGLGIQAAGIVTNEYLHKDNINDEAECFVFCCVDNDIPQGSAVSFDFNGRRMISCRNYRPTTKFIPKG